MEHVRAPSKGLSTKNVFCIGPMVICACGLLPNPAKVSNFQYRAWLCVGRNLCRGYLSRLEDYRFEISATLRQLGWIDAPHTQSFEILKSLEQTQESKKIKITWNFCKNARWLKFSWENFEIYIMNNCQKFV
jgi:hypothetical protein